MLASEELISKMNLNEKEMTKMGNDAIHSFLLNVSRINRSYLKELETVLKSQAKEPMLLLKTSFLPKKPIAFTNMFYQILASKKYRILDEVLECISSISLSSEPKKEMQIWKRCPWIDDIRYDESAKKYFLSSKEGDFSFSPTKITFEKDISSIKTYGKMKMIGRKTEPLSNGYDSSTLENLDYQCHFATFCFSQFHEDMYAVTAICPHAFSGGYWFHSYNMTNDKSTVVDISNGFIMSMEEYERLVKPQVLDCTLGEHVQAKRKDLAKFHVPYSYLLLDAPLKAFALYEYDRMSSIERSRIKLL